MGKLFLFGCVKRCHLVDVVVELSLQNHDFVQQKLLLLSFDFVYSDETFLLTLFFFIF